MLVEVNWSDDECSFAFSRVLYVYLPSASNEILYIGKADYCTVGERLRGRHKEAIFWAIDRGRRKVTPLCVIVGLLYLPTEWSAVLAARSDVEPLLILSCSRSITGKHTGPAFRVLV